MASSCTHCLLTIVYKFTGHTAFPRAHSISGDSQPSVQCPGHTHAPSPCCDQSCTDRCRSLYSPCPPEVHQTAGCSHGAAVPPTPGPSLILPPAATSSLHKVPHRLPHQILHLTPPWCRPCRLGSQLREPRHRIHRVHILQCLQDVPCWPLPYGLAVKGVGLEKLFHKGLAISSYIALPEYHH